MATRSLEDRAFQGRASERGTAAAARRDRLELSYLAAEVVFLSRETPEAKVR